MARADDRQGTRDRDDGGDRRSRLRGLEGDHRRKGARALVPARGAGHPRRGRRGLHVVGRALGGRLAHRRVGGEQAAPYARLPRARRRVDGRVHARGPGRQDRAEARPLRVRARNRLGGRALRRDRARLALRAPEPAPLPRAPRRDRPPGAVAEGQGARHGGRGLEPAAGKGRPHARGTHRRPEGGRPLSRDGRHGGRVRGPGGRERPALRVLGHGRGAERLADVPAYPRRGRADARQRPRRLPVALDLGRAEGRTSRRSASAGGDSWTRWRRTRAEARRLLPEPLYRMAGNAPAFVGPVSVVRNPGRRQGPAVPELRAALPRDVGLRPPAPERRRRHGLRRARDVGLWRALPGVPRRRPGGRANVGAHLVPVAEHREPVPVRRERSGAGVRLRALVDGAERGLAPRRSAAHPVQHDVGARPGAGDGAALRPGPGRDHLHGLGHHRLRGEQPGRRLPAVPAPVPGRRGLHGGRVGADLRPGRGAPLLRPPRRQLPHRAAGQEPRDHHADLRLHHPRHRQLGAPRRIRRRLARRDAGSTHSSPSAPTTCSWRSAASCCRCCRSASRWCTASSCSARDP